MKQRQEIKDFYAILGVSPSASTRQVQKAFRKLAQACHPDRNPSPDALRRFQELEEAYRTLKIPGKRDEFDAKIITEFCRASLGSFRDGSDEPASKPEPVIFRVLKKDSESQQE